MKLFTECIYAKLGPDFGRDLDPEEQKIFSGLQEA
jgi:hypothetical protein